MTFPAAESAQDRTLYGYLLAHASYLLDGFRRAYQKGAKLEPFLMFWPEAVLMSKEHIPVERAVIFRTRSCEEALKHAAPAAESTHAYGVLFFEPQEGQVCVTLECCAGGTQWVLPLQYHGDVHTLGQAQEKKLEASVLGIAWG